MKALYEWPTEQERDRLSWAYIFWWFRTKRASLDYDASQMFPDDDLARAKWHFAQFGTVIRALYQLSRDLPWTE